MQDSIGRLLFVAVITTVLGAGCASAPMHELGAVSPPDSDSSTQVGSKADSQEDLSASPLSDKTSPPEKTFTKEVLYELLAGELAGQRNRFQDSAEHYLDAARASRDVAVARRATRIALLAQDTERGLQAVRLWTQLAPDSTDAREVHAALLISGGLMEEVGPVLRQLMQESPKCDPDTSLDDSHPSSRQSSGEWAGPDRGRVPCPSSGSTPERFLLVAGLLAQSEDQSAALAIMEDATDRHIADHKEDEPHALFALAHLLVRFQKNDRALDLLKQVIAIDAENTLPRLYYADLLHKEGKIQEALKVLSEAPASVAKDKEIRLNLARLLIKAEKYDEARRRLERLVADSPDSTELRYTLTLLLLQTGHQQKAERHLRRLIGQEDLSQAFYFDLGQLAESQSDYPAFFQMAMDTYGKITHGNHYLDAQLRIAVLLAGKPDLAAAREHLHSVVAQSPEEAIRIYHMEGLLLTDADQLAAAISLYDKAIRDYPQDDELLYSRAMLAGRMGKVDILERDLRRLLARKPDHADALNALGYTLADKTSRYNEALALIEHALALDPDSYYVLDSMGWVLYRLGRHQEALDYLQRALEAQQDPEVAAHLGEVLWVTGDKDAARDVWEAAQEQAPEDALLQEVMGRFLFGEQDASGGKQ